MNKRQRLLICSIFLVMVIIFTAGCSGKVNYKEKIRDYCREAEIFTFPEIFDFEWDIAYVDRETYGLGY